MVAGGNTGRVAHFRPHATASGNRRGGGEVPVGGAASGGKELVINSAPVRPRSQGETSAKTVYAVCDAGTQRVCMYVYMCVR